MHPLYQVLVTTCPPGGSVTQQRYNRIDFLSAQAWMRECQGKRDTRRVELFILFDVWEAPQNGGHYGR
jgi:hypothetical protein